MEDTLRYFAEECDGIQGFHLLSDWSTGFGALANCIAELIVDEYASKSVISFPASSASCTDNVSLTFSLPFQSVTCACVCVCVYMCVCTCVCGSKWQLSTLALR